MIRSKKVLILSTGDINGAYEALYRIAIILKRLGCNVKMIVKQKTHNDSFIQQYNSKATRWDFFYKVTRKIKQRIFKEDNVQYDAKYLFLSENESKQNIEIDHFLNAIGFIPDFIFTGMTIGFLNSTDLFNIYKATQAKIYNITVDMNHFTGGCHFSWGCDGYIKGCDEKCPAIVKDDQKVIAKNNFEKKYENARKAKFQIIAGSGLTLQQAKSSKIYKNQETIYNINSLVDTNLLNDQNRSIAKVVFSLSDDYFYILAGAQNMDDPRKGFSFLMETLGILERMLSVEQRQKIVLLVVSNSVNEEFGKVTFKKQKIDYIKDYRLLSLLYQAVDLYVNSSIEDSGPMMVSEALACGTPVVGFDTGVVSNMVIDDYNGYKAPVKDCQKMAEGIKNVFELSKDSYRVFSKNAVKQVEVYSSYEYAEEIFKNILES